MTCSRRSVKGRLATYVKNKKKAEKEKAKAAAAAKPLPVEDSIAIKLIVETAA